MKSSSNNQDLPAGDAPPSTTPSGRTESLEAVQFALQQDDDCSDTEREDTDIAAAKQGEDLGAEAGVVLTPATLTPQQAKGDPPKDQAAKESAGVGTVSSAPPAVEDEKATPTSAKGEVDEDAATLPSLARSQAGTHVSQPGAQRVAGYAATGGDDEEPSNRDPEIAADLVDEAANRALVKETIKEMIPSNDALQVVDLEAENALKEQRRRRTTFLLVAVALIVGAAIVTAIVVATNNNDSGDYWEPSMAPSSSPTMAPTTKNSAVADAVVEMFGDLPEDPSAPQNRAVDWFTEEDMLTEYPIDADEDEEAAYEFYDRYAAVVLAYSTAYENWVDNTGWLDGTLSHCEWTGLTCNDDGRIGVLDLAVQNLQGSLPSEIGVLDNLDFVFMFRNQLTGTLPPELGDGWGDVDFLYLNENR